MSGTAHDSHFWPAVSASVGLILLDLALLAAGTRLEVGALTVSAYLVFPFLLYPMKRVRHQG